MTGTVLATHHDCINSFLNGRLSDSVRNMGHSMPICRFIMFLALNAVFGIKCCVWQLMSEMSFNAKNGIVLGFRVEKVMIPMLTGIKC